jgi:putative membrane protein
MEQLMSELHFAPILSTIVYSLIGIVIFIIAYKIIDTFTPFSVHKEISEDHNIALGVIIGSVMIALSIIIAAAIK